MAIWDRDKAWELGFQISGQANLSWKWLNSMEIESLGAPNPYFLKRASGWVHIPFSAPPPNQHPEHDTSGSHGDHMDRPGCMPYNAWGSRKIQPRILPEKMPVDIRWELWMTYVFSASHGPKLVSSVVIYSSSMVISDKGRFSSCLFLCLCLSHTPGRLLNYVELLHLGLAVRLKS